MLILLFLLFQFLFINQVSGDTLFLSSSYSLNGGSHFQCQYDNFKGSFYGVRLELDSKTKKPELEALLVEGPQFKLGSVKKQGLSSFIGVSSISQNQLLNLNKSSIPQGALSGSSSPMGGATLYYKGWGVSVFEEKEFLQSQFFFDSPVISSLALSCISSVSLKSGPQKTKIEPWYKPTPLETRSSLLLNQFGFKICFYQKKFDIGAQGALSFSDSEIPGARGGGFINFYTDFVEGSFFASYDSSSYMSSLASLEGRATSLGGDLTGYIGREILIKGGVDYYIKEYSPSDFSWILSLVGSYRSFFWDFYSKSDTFKRENLLLKETYLYETLHFGGSQVFHLNKLEIELAEDIHQLPHPFTPLEGDLYFKLAYAIQPFIGIKGSCHYHFDQQKIFMELSTVLSFSWNKFFIKIEGASPFLLAEKREGESDLNPFKLGLYLSFRPL